MKKMKILTLLLCASLAFAYMGCSNSSGGSGTGTGGSGGGQGGGEEIQTFTFTGTPYTELSAGTDGTKGTSATYANFGDWPQSAKEDGVTVDETESVVQGTYTYYKGSDDAWYAKIISNYYKVEPIKWRVLTTNYNGTGKKLLLAENILINCAYYDYYDEYRTVGETTIYPNNYEHSRVRAYLNGLSYQKKSVITEQTEDSSLLNKGFLQTAFTSTLQTAIAEASVINNARSANPDGDSNASLWNSGNNQYASDTHTTDKIFLLSEQEVTKTEYGFAAYNQSGQGNVRIRVATDFAASCGVNQSTTTGYGGYWWLRTPYYMRSYCALCMYDDGDAYNWFIVDQAKIGIVPALCLN